MGEVAEGHAKQGERAFPEVLPGALKHPQKESSHAGTGGDAVEHQGGVAAGCGAEDDVIAHQGLRHQAFFPEPFDFLGDFLGDVFRPLNEAHLDVGGGFVDEKKGRGHQGEYLAELVVRLLEDGIGRGVAVEALVKAAGIAHLGEHRLGEEQFLFQVEDAGLELLEFTLHGGKRGA